MFYIIETSYTGPNQHEDRFVDADRIEICTTPARTNSSNEVRIEGWCGTSNDWALHAHGKFATLEAARAAIPVMFGEVRDRSPDGERFVSDREGVIETYKPGKYTPMSCDQTADWSYEGIMADIAADTSDERIAALVIQYEAEANNEGYTLDGDLECFMCDRRQELREAQEEQD